MVRYLAGQGKRRWRGYKDRRMNWERNVVLDKGISTKLGYTLQPAPY